MTSTQRIVFIDVDGTILEHGAHVEQSSVTAIDTARRNGHLVFLCTGRSRGDLHPDVAAIDVDGAITNGGVTAEMGRSTIVSRPMPPASVERIVGVFRERGIEYFLQTDDAVYATEGMRDLIRQYARASAAREESGPEDALAGPAHRNYPDVADAPADRIGKAVFVGLATDDLEVVTRELGESFHVVPGSIPMPGGSNGEICVRGTDKGSAITRVLDHLGLDPTDAIGIGDSWNDVEMFQVCGTAVAMGNAHAELKDLADRVTTDVGDDGVWNAFRDLGLLDPVG
ncbi:Cof-type HAD-IIB family hydrolase [Microbacterium koreense]|uniref:Cof-type HAD-IIB family hydrolase n=1 Tax=Microbacterium koreense TaxID=323761 RepID=A0ABW2ZMX6_9MICO